ncbi:hypothetical protein M9H77_34799 [Catharanthus roseus]|uniref:Uncharacterized protein n=1 Tax=Catharanthus roseus TaxID=4058 RepID=A0ACB9ZNX1_CATRO|nr:hypothetical protein M9H77_34799 [Catharanthus roseus]
MCSFGQDSGKQSVTNEHLIKDRTAPVVIHNVSCDILAMIVEYCKSVATQPLFGENDIELKVFVSKLVNDNDQTLFGLLVAADYLNIKGLLSLACEDAFQYHAEIFPRRRGKDRRANPWAFN